MTHPFLTEGIPVREDREINKPATSPLVISKFYVKSDIRFRFATTVMSTTMFNTNSHSSTEATFSAELPEKGYISYFTMTIGERVIVGEVKENKEAKEKYDTATARGETAALVSEVPRETNRFDISVNVAASSSVLFNLTYVEVLERKLSCYRHILNIKPNQIVKDYFIHVSIHESRRIKEVKVPLISTDVSKEHLTLKKILRNQNNVDISYDVSGKSCNITYMPTVQQQKEIHQYLGVNGQFSVFYDVSRQDDAGDILVSNGYFLHFFAPDPDEAGVMILPKHIVFILDTSGSMSGRKIMQLKDAMVRILAELNDKDCFNIIQFNHKITKWKNNIQDIGKKEEGKTFVNSLEAEGGTDIGRALSEGLSTLKQNPRESVIPTIFFLTDGKPHNGDRNTCTILESIRQQSEQINSRIYSLAFGNDADIHFLQQLSSDHGAVCRNIYMDSDADLQVSGFYKEISSPLLSHLNITYVNVNNNHKEAEITQNLCQLKRDQALTGGGIYYSGDEYVVCGRAESERVIGRIRGRTESGGINMKAEGKYFEDKSGDIGRVIEKVWVCLTIRRILAEMDETNSANEKQQLRKKALQLSLKYGLVTALTSMVVTEENADERKIEKCKERPARKPRRLPQSNSKVVPQSCILPKMAKAKSIVNSRSRPRRKSATLKCGRKSLVKSKKSLRPISKSTFRKKSGVKSGSKSGVKSKSKSGVKSISNSLGKPRNSLVRSVDGRFKSKSGSVPRVKSRRKSLVKTASKPSHVATRQMSSKSHSWSSKEIPKQLIGPAGVVGSVRKSISENVAPTVDTVTEKGSIMTTLYDGSRDSPGSHLFIRGGVQDSLILEIIIEYSTYTINITPYKIQVNDNHTGHTQTHTWGMNEVEVGDLKIMMHTDRLELEIDTENALKFRINREKNVKGMHFLHFRDF